MSDSCNIPTPDAVLSDDELKAASGGLIPIPFPSDKAKEKKKRPLAEGQSPWAPLNDTLLIDEIHIH